MKTTVNQSDFHNAFINYNRKENFSYEGRVALFEYIEEFEDSTGEEMELDVIAICCEYTEYDSIRDFWQDYDEEDYPTIDDIEDATQVIRFKTDSFIVQQF